MQAEAATELVAAVTTTKPELKITTTRQRKTKTRIKKATVGEEMNKVNYSFQ